MAEPKKYVGMRYVPKFAEPLEWNTNNKYEPLEMVLHEGNYYISRQFVPMDIDILNKEYWLPFALTLDGAAGLVSRVDSNTDAIIKNITAIHEVDNKATQNALDIAGNTADISTNLEMINKLIDHLTLTKVRYMPAEKFGGGGINYSISKDRRILIMSVDIYGIKPNQFTEIEIFPANTLNSNVYFRYYYALFAGKNLSSIIVNTNGSIIFTVPKESTSINGSFTIDLGLTDNTMTLPMTEEDYNQLESEVK